MTDGRGNEGKGHARRALTLALLTLTACKPKATVVPGQAAPNAPSDSIVARAPRGAADSLFPAPSRPVSSIVSPHWSNADARDNAGEARRVLDLAGVAPGVAVADIGAGDGYYTQRAAARVGPTGHILAEDIRADYLGLLRDRLRASPMPNVVLALGEPHDPRLPAASVDVVLMIHMYHEITQPFGLLYNLYPALRPGARVVIVDQERPTGAHGTPTDLLHCEVGAMGYRWHGRTSLGDGAYAAVFDAPAARDSLTAPARVQAALDARGCASLMEPGL